MDYYKILELPKTATKADNKKIAYRKLERKYYPDCSPNIFKEVEDAIKVLSHT